MRHQKLSSYLLAELFELLSVFCKVELRGPIDQSNEPIPWVAELPPPARFILKKPLLLSAAAEFAELDELGDVAVECQSIG